MATAAVIGRLVVNIEARYEKLMTGIKKAGDAIGHFTARVTRWIGTNFEKIMLGMTATATAAFYGVASAVMESTQAIDNLNDAAGKLGTTTDMLAKLRHAGKMSGVEFEAMDSAIEKMLKNMSSARMGSGPAVQAFEELRLSAYELSRLSLDKQMERIAEAIANISSNEDRLRLTMAIFGKSGGGLVNTFKDGAAGIREMATEAERLGIAIKQQDAEKVAEMADAWDRLKAAAGGLASSLTINIAPLATQTINDLKDIVAFIRSRQGTASRAVGALRAVAESNPLGRMFARGSKAGGLFGRFAELARDYQAPTVGRGSPGYGTPNFAEIMRQQRMMFPGIFESQGSKGPAIFGQAGDAIRSATQLFLNAAQTADKALYANIEPARVFATDALKKIEKENEQVDKFKELGKTLNEEFMSPLDRLTKRQKEIDEALRRGTIDKQVAFAAKNAAQEDFLQQRRDEMESIQGEYKPRRELSLLESGTNEAFAALRRNMHGGSGDKLLDVNKKQLQVHEKALGQLEKMAGVWEKLNVEIVGIN